jgi:hypothetical protein
MTVVEIVTGASFICKPPVDRHVLFVHLSDKGLIPLPKKLLDFVPFADVCYKSYKSLVSFIGNGPVRGSSIVGHFNGNGSVVIRF